MVYPMVNYSVIKRNEILKQATTWTNLKNIMGNEKKPDTKVHIQFIYEIIILGIETRSRFAVARG